MADIAFKSYDVQLKDVSSDGSTGVVEAIVSVFGNVDSVNDITEQGAFSKTLTEWQVKGDPIPFVFSHQWDNPDAYLGAIVDAKEVPEGLYVKAQVDLADPAAAKVHRLLKQRLITQFSFGYIPREWEMKDDPEHGKVRVLKDVQLIEAGPTLLGANTSTRLIQAASAASARKDMNESESIYPTLPRQNSIADAMSDVVEVFGKFDQSSGADGAHYMIDNPFVAEGLKCSNCTFYEGSRACELVSGDIDPNALCKLWVIPEALLAGNAAPEIASTEADTKSSEAAETADETTTDLAVLFLLTRHAQDRDMAGIIGNDGGALALSEGTESPDKENV